MKKLLMLFLSLFISPVFGSGIASNTASAPCTNNTLETYSGNSNLQADWQPNTINLRWYNENEKLTVQQSAQTCTYDGTLTVPQTPPTRTGYTFAGWKVRIPGTYTELEYLESYGKRSDNTGQYIDTGVILDVNSKIETKVSVPTYLGNYAIFGASNGNFYDKGEIALFYNYNGYPVFEPVIPTSNSESLVPFRSACIPNTEYIVLMDKNTLVFNGQARTTGWYASYQGTRTAYLFATNRGADSWIGGNTRIYYFKIWNNNTLIRDFIPVRRNSDNVLGMYDIVSQTFFTNTGTGSFIAGPVVQ